VNAPLTRCRGHLKGVATDANFEFYSSRAGYGLIITECSGISDDGNAWPGCLCVYIMDLKLFKKLK
jgi:2,4-dienoyl-CoA reductase-like NADH-dependent reductase (Old Yellow Enzyme family)